MAIKGPLEPSEAEQVAADVRTEHGLGQKYRIKVESSHHGWHVLDQKGQIESVRPMPAEEWREYLEERFVEAITQHDETSEA